MADFSYQLGFSVAKTLTTVSDPLVDVNFCAVGSTVQTPPVLRFNISSFGTSTVEGVYSDCVPIGVGTGTVATTVALATPFGTNATASHMLITETSGNTSAFATVVCVTGPAKQTFSTIGPSGSILLRMPSSTGYAAYSSNAATTCTLQVIIVGE